MMGKVIKKASSDQGKDHFLPAQIYRGIESRCILHSTFGYILFSGVNSFKNQQFLGVYL